MPSSILLCNPSCFIRRRNTPGLREVNHVFTPDLPLTIPQAWCSTEENMSESRPVLILARFSGTGSINHYMCQTLPFLLIVVCSLSNWEVY